MNPRTRRMKQTATYWGRPTDDGLGNKTFPAPETLGVRWEAKSELFRDSEANEVSSTAVVYVPKALEIEGYLYLGESAEADPRGVDGAHEIRQIGGTPNLRQTVQVHKVWL